MIGFLLLCMLNLSAAIDEKYDMMAKTCYGDNAFTANRINSGYLRVILEHLRLEPETHTSQTWTWASIWSYIGNVWRSLARICAWGDYQYHQWKQHANQQRWNLLKTACIEYVTYYMWQISVLLSPTTSVSISNRAKNCHQHLGSVTSRSHWKILSL